MQLCFISSGTANLSKARRHFFFRPFYQLFGLFSEYVKILYSSSLCMRTIIGFKRVILWAYIGLVEIHFWQQFDSRPLNLLHSFENEICALPKKNSCIVVLFLLCFFKLQFTLQISNPRQVLLTLAKRKRITRTITSTGNK